MHFRTTILYTGIALCVVLITGVIWSIVEEQTTYTHVFKTESGFGYAIIDHGQILIRQEYIPAIANHQSFCSETDAERVGELVLQKINRNLSPSITRQELQSLGIRVDCNAITD